MMHLYIHVPFCEAKCGYCAFYSEVNRSQSVVNAWLKKIITEVIHLNLLKVPIQTIFIGGGTPTALPLVSFKQLLNALSQLKKSDDYEFSVECNPESLSLEKAEIMKACGVNRLSIGVQSLSQPLRDILQRKGSIEALIPLIRELRKFSFKSMNADLIYAIPTQTIQQAKDDIITLLDEGLEHLSCYSLTPEEGSRLFDTFSQIDADHISGDIWSLIPSWIAPYGLKRYEVSNYAKVGFECKHNLNIWLGEPYYGLGPAAASYNGVTRSIESPNILNWLNNTPPEIDVISPIQRANEVFAFGLRTTQGWIPEVCMRATGQKPEYWVPALESFIEQKYILFKEDGTMQLTEKGLMFWDTIAEEII